MLWSLLPVKLVINATTHYQCYPIKTS